MLNSFLLSGDKFPTCTFMKVEIYTSFLLGCCKMVCSLSSSIITTFDVMLVLVGNGIVELFANEGGS